MSANLQRAASKASTDSGSSVSSSTLSTSSDDESSSSLSSSSSSSSASPSTQRSNPAPSPAPASAGNRPSGAAPGGGSGQWRVRPNPVLQFAHPDTEYIPVPKAQIPAQVSTVLQRMTGDKNLYPEGRYRSLDYFRVAVEMFVDAVRAEYRHQQQTAARNGRSLNRFTWKNDGELAVCFACCCDWMKILFSKLAPSPFKPLQDDFVSQMKSMLMALSRVPVEILPRKTYDTKYLDWEKGGTRYHSGQSSANVRFPSAQDRRTKIETYLRTRAGFRIEPVKVDPARPPNAAAAAAAAPAGARTPAAPTGGAVAIKTAAPAAAAAAATTGRTSVAAPGPAPFVPPFTGAKGPGPVRTSVAAPRGPLVMKATPGQARHPPAASAVKQMPEEMRHLYWLSCLAHVKGGEPGAAFPEERTATLPALVRLCEITEQPEEIAVLVDVVASSTEMVQQVFEGLGGLVAFRRLFGRVVKQSATAGHRGVMTFIERIVRLKAHHWSAASQAAWRTGMDGKSNDDLNWLRALPVIPTGKRAAWGALILVMEEKFIFRLPREEAEAARKRSRLEASVSVDSTSSTGGTPIMDSMRMAVADNVGMAQWKVPRAYTLSTVRLPTELRAPPLSSETEQESIAFINRKREFAEATQTEWEGKLRSMLKTSLPAAAAEAVPIPVWYDPFQLLGIDPLQ